MVPTKKVAQSKTEALSNFYTREGLVDVASLGVPKSESRLGAVSALSLRNAAAPTGGLTTASPAIVVYGWFINLEKGDQVRFSLAGPDGEIARKRFKPLDRAKAAFASFAGKRNKGEAWPSGR